MRTRDTGQNSVEPSEGQDPDTGTFFTKYAPPNSPQPDAPNNFFYKYVPSKSRDADEVHEQSEPDQSGLGPDYEDFAAGDHHPDKQVYPAWVILTCILLGLIAIATTIVMLSASRRQIVPASVNSPPATEDAAAAADSQPDEAQPGILFTNMKDPVMKGRVRLAQPQHMSNSIPSKWVLTAMLARARQFEDRGMLGEAEQTYRDILREYPDEQSSQAALGRIQNKVSSRRALDSVRASREAGLRKFRLGDYLGAEPELAAAVNAGRTDTATLYALGMSYLNLRNYPKAVAVLNNCIAADPDYGPAVVGLAQAKLSMGEREQARLLLERASQLGGGTEYPSSKISEMISSLRPKAPPLPTRPRSHFFAYALHRHSFPLTWCRGELTITNSVVEFKSGKPSHSFRVSSSLVVQADQSGNELRLRVNGKPYKLTLEGKSALDFQTSLNP